MRSLLSARAAAGVMLAAFAPLVLATGQGVADDLDEIGDPLPDVRRAAVTVDLEVVTLGVMAPVDGITAPGRPDDLFVVDQVGVLWQVDVTAPPPVEPAAVLQISQLLAGPVANDDERGFLGAAFSPTFAQDGLLFTYTSEPAGTATPDYSTIPAEHPCRGLVDDDQELAVPAANHQTVIRRWHSEPGTLSFTHSDILLVVDQPQSNHNAGAVHFGGDHMLYIAFGDGGGADDQDCQTNFDGTPMFGHGPGGNGQDPSTPLGDILRIDVIRADGASTPSANGRDYGIPADNPSFSSPDAMPELYAMGFRNPFRFSFDRATDELWVGDVGQNHIEEVDVVTAGGNYGWRVREGGFDFTPSGFQLKGSESDGFPFARTAAPQLVAPVAQYDHDDGTAVIGGFVYRGEDMPSLQGQYVFGDTSRRLNNGHGRLFATDADGRQATGNEIVELRDGPLDFQLIGFGEDSAGELYALVFGFDGPDDDTGAVLRIREATGDSD